MKKLYFLALVLLLHNIAISQTYTPPTYADVDTTFNNHVNNVFGVLEPNRVSTGLLFLSNVSRRGRCVK